VPPDIEWNAAMLTAHLLEEHDAKVKALEAALLEGEQSGEPRPLDFEAFKARMRAEAMTT